MFRLCSEKFRATAIEKNCILFMLYQNSRNSRTENRQQKKRIKRKYVRFYYRKCVLFECEKIMYYHIQCIGGGILHLKSDFTFAVAYCGVQLILNDFSSHRESQNRNLTTYHPLFHIHIYTNQKISLHTIKGKR